MRYIRYALVLSLLLPAFAEAGVIENSRTVQVSGEHTIYAMPDMAILQLSAFGDAVSVEQAKAQADAQLRAIKTVTSRAGIKDKHIMTSAMRVTPRYTYPQNRDRILEAYEVTYDIKLKLYDLSATGTLLQQLTTSGVNRIDGLNYMLENDNDVMKQALIAALHNAHDKADVIATASDASLGHALQITTSYAMPNPPVMMRSMMMSDKMSTEASVAPPVGELNVSAQVNVVYELNPIAR